MKEVRSEIEINSYPESVWNILIDFAAYDKWNPFINKIVGVPTEGSKIDIYIETPSGKNRNSDESKQKFMKIIEAYEVLSDEHSRKNYDSNALQKRGARTRWTPSADFGTVYSYEEIKRRYRPNNVGGGMWDISEKASFGIWKATILLFACLVALLIYIILLS